MDDTVQAEHLGYWQIMSLGLLQLFNVCDCGLLGKVTTAVV
jgi:hypothetical protein